MAQKTLALSSRILRIQSRYSAPSRPSARISHMMALRAMGIMREGHFIRELHRIHSASPLQKRSSYPEVPGSPACVQGRRVLAPLQ